MNNYNGVTNNLNEVTSNSNEVTSDLNEVASDLNEVTNNINEVINNVKLIIKEVLEIEYELTPKTNITDLGVDSINFMKIVIALEEAYEFEFDDFMLTFDQFKNIEVISEYINVKKTE